MSLTPQERFEVFGETTSDLSYATEAEPKWAHSQGQREAMAREAARTKPAAHPHQARPAPARPRYDPRAVCAWARGISIDPSVVSACRQQLGR